MSQEPLGFPSYSSGSVKDQVLNKRSGQNAGEGHSGDGRESQSGMLQLAVLCAESDSRGRPRIELSCFKKYVTHQFQDGVSFVSVWVDQERGCHVLD